MSLVQCAPELGRGEPEVVDALVEAVLAISGVRLIERDGDARGRSGAFAFAVHAGRAIEAAFRTVTEACERIDVRAEGLLRPPTGAVEVLTFAPLGEGTLEGCTALAHKLGDKVGRELVIPVYYFGTAALRPERRDLDTRRRDVDPRRRDDEPERSDLHPERRDKDSERRDKDSERRDADGLAAVLGERAIEREPDVGPLRPHLTAGVIAIGARRQRLVLRVELESDDLEIARHVARRVRDHDGGLPGTEARGVLYREGGAAEVELVLHDHTQVGVVRAYEQIERLAAERGVAAGASRLIGLVPRAALPPGAQERARISGFDPARQLIEEILGR